MKIISRLFAALLLLAVSGTVSAGHSFSQGDITITHPWSRPTPPGVTVGVGYMAVSNHGDSAITLIGASTPKAGRVTIHQSRMKDGMTSMRPLPAGLTIPAGETVMLAPHGYHLMLERLDGALGKGERIPMTISFDGAESVQVELHTTPMKHGAMDGDEMHRH